MAIYLAIDLGTTGCRSIFDVAPADLSLMTREELLAKLL